VNQHAHKHAYVGRRGQRAGSIPVAKSSADRTSISPSSLFQVSHGDDVVKAGVAAVGGRSAETGIGTS
jgi:hypothetical protein